MTRPDGFDDLPRRFRDYVRTLEDANKALRDSRPSTGRTSVEVVDYLAKDEDKTYLSDGTRIRFRVGDAEFEVGAARPHRTVSGSAIEISLNQSLSSSLLAVLPEAGNIVVIVPRGNL